MFFVVPGLVGGGGGAFYPGSCLVLTVALGRKNVMPFSEARREEAHGPGVP